MAMDPKIKARFLKALRSGEYKQGRGALYELKIRNKQIVECFCPLGVLINEMDAWEECRKCYARVFADPYATTRRAFNTLTHIGGAFCPQNSGVEDAAVFSIVNMNDRGRKSFKQIASWIEKNL